MSEYRKYIIFKTVDLPEEEKYHGLSKDSEYRHLYTLDSLGFPSGTVEMTEEEKELVESLPQVREVLPDQTVTVPTPVEAEDVGEEGLAALDQIRATQAHEKGFRGEGIKVAVLDTGLDKTHAETTFKDRLVATATFVGDGTWHDRQSGHGTWCCGAVAAPQYGVAPKSLLLVGKVLGDNGSGSTSGIIEGIGWAVRNGAKVISMSLGGDGNPNDAMSRAVDGARAKGVITVAAAGNDQRGTTALTADTHTPGAAPKAMTSAALNVSDELAPFSSWGKCVDIAGPGWNIAGLGLNGTTGRSMSGTSMSTPHNAGGVVLCVQKKDDPTAIEQAVYSTARKLNYEAIKTGHGVMNVSAALDALGGTTPPPPAGYFPNLSRVGLSTLNRERGALLEKECILFVQPTPADAKRDVGHYIPKALGR